MSFHSEILAVLLTDLATATSVNAAGIYGGRNAQRVTRSGVEIWVQSRGVADAAEGNGAVLKAHTYDVHVRLKQVAEGNGTRAVAEATIKGHLETIRLRYHGKRNFYATRSDLLYIRAVEGQITEDREHPDTLDGVVTLTFWEM